MKAKQFTKAPCNRCNRETKHVVLKKRLTSDEAEATGYGPVSWQDLYEMLRWALGPRPGEVCQNGVFFPL